MKIYTLSNNVVYSNSSKNLIPDANLPIYSNNYDIFSTSPDASILVSTIGLLPDNENPNRVGSLKIGGTCSSGMPLSIIISNSNSQFLFFVLHICIL